MGTVLIGTTAGLLGTFAVLRRRALIADALAHAALPGICLGYLLAGGANLAIQFISAFICGLISIFIIRQLPIISTTRPETAIAGVLSVFFGAGIVLTRWIQNRGDFGGRAGLDAFLFGSPSSLLIEDVYLISFICALVILTIMFTYRLSLAVTFDPTYLEVQGQPTRVIDWIHLVLLMLTVIVGLPAMGVVMMVALIVTPAASARLISERFLKILICSALFGAMSAGIGTWLSAQNAKLPAGATTVLVATCLFLSLLLFKKLAESFKPAAVAREYQQTNDLAQ